MLELRKFVAPEFIFGQGAIELIGRYAINFGTIKPLIVTDNGVIAAGWKDKVVEHLKRDNINCAVFSEISPNPRDHEVMKGAELYENNHCDLIIAIGGGSPMDCAKAIGIVSTNKQHVLEFEGVDNVDIPGPPLICIPTTAGTSADVSQFAIINDTKRMVKIAIISKTMVPDVALIDPETTLTMVPYLTACTGMDALVHAIEAAASTASSPITDNQAFAAIRRIRKYLPLVMQQPDNLEFRGQMMTGSLEAGLAFSNASLGAVHAMAHALGGLLDLPHGEANAVLLPHVIEFNYSEASGRYDLIAEALGLNIKNKTPAERLQMLLQDIRELNKEVGITVTLSTRGTQKSDIQRLAKNALNDACMVTNPRSPEARDIEVVYEEAL